jgi:cobalt-zinc-cadmium efflux system outer membrane protein
MAIISMFKNSVQLPITGVALIVLLVVSLPLQASSSITLASAIEQTLAKNPDLQVFPFKEKALQGKAQTEALRPALEAGIEVENFAGSGDFSGTDGMDTTLSLSSVLELSHKRDARMAISDARLARLQAEQEVAALDASGEVARRFLDALVAQERLALAREAEKLASETVQVVKRRAEAGGGSQADVLRAKASLEQSRLASAHAAGTARANRILLASLWGETEPDFLTVSGDLLAVGSQESVASLYERASRNPSVLMLASVTRLKDAEVRIAQANARRDINWSAGVRQLNETDDTALVASMSVPLFAGRRNAGALQAAQAEKDEATFMQDATLQQLKARLYALHGQRQQSLDEVHALQTTVIPLLEQALQSTRAAFANGQLGYQEWLVSRQELLSARIALLDTADEASRLRIDIEQLTAEPLLKNSQE